MRTIFHFVGKNFNCFFKKISFLFKQISFISSFVLLLTSNALAEPHAVGVSGQEYAVLTTQSLQVWSDESAKKSLETAKDAFSAGQFRPFNSNHSTGLIEGALWSHFQLKNITSKAITLNIEYVDHQLIRLEAYAAMADGEFPHKKIADISLSQPFSERQFAHNRFVFETLIPANQTLDYFVKYSSEGKGYVFPNLRVWEPNNLRKMQNLEIAGIAFLIGGFLLMSIFAFIAGIATQEKFFYAYAVYALAKIIAWATIFGYTHELVLDKEFHWSYISISAAITIFCGLVFSRWFLQTSKYTPKLNYIMLFMMANASFLFVSALLEFKAAAIISITLALLLYPIIFIAAVNRWRQGSKEAGVFALAWSFLALGLVVQALRDLGFVEHNFVNYYWPPFASYTEMIVIMVAMGLKVRLLRLQKLTAERKYRMELEQSKSRLEVLVKERTQALEQEKRKAELEAQTDSLTGTRNRRSFFALSEKLLSRSGQPPKPLSLLMFDIDNFKHINDTYGHAIGDEALKTFCEAISARIRDTDIFARLGGEEFSLVLEGGREHALQMAERLRSDVCNIKIDTPNGDLTFTTSIGIAHFKDEDMIDDLMHQADTALYEAKSMGRNRVVEANEGQH